MSHQHQLVNIPRLSFNDLPRFHQWIPLCFFLCPSLPVDTQTPVVGSEIDLPDHPVDATGLGFDQPFCIIA